MEELKAVVMETLKALSGRCVTGVAAPSVKWMGEYRLLVEECRKLEDAGEVGSLKSAVEGLLKRVVDLESQLNMRRMQMEAGVRRTPRIMG